MYTVCFIMFLSQTMSQKRERSINFTREEVDILVQLVEMNKHILENKKSDAVTWKQKKQCWKAIEVAFNSASGSTYRTSKNLRLKYESMKRDNRRKSAHAPVLSPTESKVKDITLLSIDGMESNFDSDCLPNAVGKPKPKRPFEQLVDSKMEIAELQQQILEEEYSNKKLQWAFEEEERQHKREMWALEKELLLKKINK